MQEYQYQVLRDTLIRVEAKLDKLLLNNNKPSAPTAKQRMQTVELILKVLPEDGGTMHYLDIHEALKKFPECSDLKPETTRSVLNKLATRGSIKKLEGVNGRYGRPDALATHTAADVGAFVASA